RRRILDGLQQWRKRIRLLCRQSRYLRFERIVEQGLRVGELTEVNAQRSRKLRKIGAERCGEQRKGLRALDRHVFKVDADALGELSQTTGQVRQAEPQRAGQFREAYAERRRHAAERFDARCGEVFQIDTELRRKRFE